MYHIYRTAVVVTLARMHCCVRILRSVENKCPHYTFIYAYRSLSSYRSSQPLLLQTSVPKFSLLCDYLHSLARISQVGFARQCRAHQSKKGSGYARALIS